MAEEAFSLKDAIALYSGKRRIELVSSKDQAGGFKSLRTHQEPRKPIKYKDLTRRIPGDILDSAGSGTSVLARHSGRPY